MVIFNLLTQLLCLLPQLIQFRNECPVLLEDKRSAIEDEEDQEDDVSMMEQDEDLQAGDHSDGLGYAAAASADAPGNGQHLVEGDDEAYFSCMEHAASGQVHPIHGSSSTMDEEMSDVEEEDLGTAQVTGTDNLEMKSESKARAVSIASDDL